MRTLVSYCESLFNYWRPFSLAAEKSSFLGPCVLRNERFECLYQHKSTRSYCQAVHQFKLQNSVKTMDPFKEEFKRYKKRNASPDLSEVIDFDKEDKRVFCVPTVNVNCPVLKCLHHASQWRIFGVKSCPGLMLIRNPFKPGYHRYWVKRCLHDYPCKPNMTNLDAHMKIEEDVNLWDLNVKNPEGSLMKKLRWTTLGYHYDWNTKEYYENQQSPFPLDLSVLAKNIASVLGYVGYTPETAIVNYYFLDSTLSGHVDRSELDLDSPLIAVSFGQSAVFLIGGETKETRPEALFLHSGDVMVMSGPARLAYHAIPKIFVPEGEDIHHKFDWAPTLKLDSVIKTNDNTLTAAVDNNDGESETKRVKLDVWGAVERPANSQTHCKQIEKSVEELASQDSQTLLKDNHGESTKCNQEFQEIEEINSIIDSEMENLDWAAYGSWVKTARMNISIRQAKKVGQQFSEKPQ